jgi:serine/threonine protein kinase
LPEGSCEYKYVICGPGGDVVCWEGGSNRQLVATTADEGLVIKETFGHGGRAISSHGSACSSIDAQKLPAAARRASRARTKSTTFSESEAIRTNDSDSSEEEELSTSDCEFDETLHLTPFSQGEDLDLMEEGESFGERFEIRGKLGKGAFGVVSACMDRRRGQEYAMKSVRKDLDAAGHFGQEGEVCLQRALPRHAHILSLLAVFDEPLEVRLLMPICRGGDLCDTIAKAREDDRALSEKASSNVVGQLLSALAFCHEHGVVHRDVKAENVLLTHPVQQVPLENAGAQIRLCDFGLAARHRPGDPPMRMLAGSAEYMAPEMARREPYDSAVDVWSAGVVLFCCLRGRLPFADQRVQRVLWLVQKGQPDFASGWNDITHEARCTVQDLMEVEPTARPTAEEAAQLPWFVSASDAAAAPTTG